MSSIKHKEAVLNDDQAIYVYSQFIRNVFERFRNDSIDDN